MKDKKLCACGCGGEIVLRSWHKWEGTPSYIRGHHMRGIKLTEKWKKNIGKSISGWHKEVGFSKLTIKKIKKANRERDNSIIYTEQVRKNMSRIKKKQIKKNGHSWEGKHHKKKTKELLRKINLGRKQSDSERENRSKSLTGKRNPNWYGGVSFEIYPQEFNKKFKRKIREREGYKCLLCGLKENGKKHCVHHINYDKMDTTLENCCCLCDLCHCPTISNREMWTSALIGLMVDKYAYVY